MKAEDKSWCFSRCLCGSLDVLFFTERRQCMTYEQITESLASCGLSCEKCFAHVDGDIRQYSLKLKVNLYHFII